MVHAAAQLVHLDCRGIRLDGFPLIHVVPLVDVFRTGGHAVLLWGGFILGLDLDLFEGSSFLLFGMSSGAGESKVLSCLSTYSASRT